MKKSSVIIFGVLIIFTILVVPKLIKKSSNDSKVDNTNTTTNTTTTKISNDRFIAETKRMIKNAQHQYLNNFGKWNYYALDGSRDKNSIPVTTKECTATDGIDVTTDASGNIKQYCRINHDKEIILKSFIVTFNESTAEVKTVYSSDGIHSYKFDSSIDGAFDFSNIK